MTCQRCGKPHGRCQAHNRQGQPCGLRPIAGADKCKLHLGRRLQDVRNEHAARMAVETYGLPVDIDPHDALLQEVQRTAGHVVWLAQIVNSLEQGDLIWGVAQEKQGGEDWGTTYKAAPNIWVTLYQQERLHLVRVCKAAIDAGIEERRVRIAEQTGEAIVTVIRATLDELGVDVTPDVAATVGRHLRAVA